MVDKPRFTIGVDAIGEEKSLCVIEHTGMFSSVVCCFTSKDKKDFENVLEVVKKLFNSPIIVEEPKLKKI